MHYMKYSPFPYSYMKSNLNEFQHDYIYNFDVFSLVTLLKLHTKVHCIQKCIEVQWLITKELPEFMDIN